MQYFLIKTKRILFNIDNKYYFKIFFLFLITFLSSFLEIIGIGLLIPYVSIFYPSENLINDEIFRFLSYFVSENNYVFVITITFLIVIILSTLIKVYMTFYLNYLSHIIGGELSANIFHKEISKNYLNFIEKHSSDSLSNVKVKSNAVLSHFLLPVFNIINSLLIFFVIFIFLFLINPITVLSSATIIIIIYLLISEFFKSKLNISSHIISSYENKVMKILQEAFLGFRNVILSKKQAYLYNHYRNLDIKLRSERSYVISISQFTRYFVEGIILILVILFTYFFINQNNNILVISSIVPIIYGFLKILPLIQNIYSNITLIRGSKKIIFEISDILSQKLNNSDIPNNQLDKYLELKKNITFKNVSFFYPNRPSKLVINNLSLSLQHPALTLIVGKTGIGKSTVLDLLTGLIQPTSGQILIDEQLLSQNNSYYWQNCIQYISQKIYLEDTTISEYITNKYKKELSENDELIIKKILKEVEIYDEIKNFQENIYSYLGEDGVNLSGGQRQRLAIARALFNIPKILILDEALSGIDDKTKIKIINNLKNNYKEMSILLVTHDKNLFNISTNRIDLNEI